MLRRRSEKNSSDFATTADVIIEVVQEYKKRGIEFEYLCCIYPTAPLLNENVLIEGFNLLINNKYDTLFPIVRYSYPIQRALEVYKSKVKMILPENLNKRSQDLKSSYHDAGQCYLIKNKGFEKRSKLFTDNSGTIILDELLVQDIDTLSDWQIAELKYQIKQ